jgi:hypothetical protein
LSPLVLAPGISQLGLYHREICPRLPIIQPEQHGPLGYRSAWLQIEFHHPATHLCGQLYRVQSPQIRDSADGITHRLPFRRYHIDGAGLSLATALATVSGLKVQVYTRACSYHHNQNDSDQPLFPHGFC